jgi:hypothetical protein
MNFGVEWHYLVAKPDTVHIKKNEFYDIVAGTGHINGWLFFKEKQKSGHASLYGIHIFSFGALLTKIIV